VSRTVIVIPCFNERRRLDREQVLELASGAGVLLVDDGSRDHTAGLLAELEAERPSDIQALVFPENRGKAEAVRSGMLVAATDADVVGYLDADFSTPAREMLRLIERRAELGADVLIGARVARLGADIVRRATRHYLGRVFATAASLTLRQPVYDTQCGAKLFVVTPALSAALAAPFGSRWAFDVELLGRLLDAGLGPDALVEMPLAHWSDPGGSKLRASSMARAGLDLLAIAARRRARKLFG
jgi:dolichyl-phosphate beta-glucosyltransferase